jgi:CheY-like chemotaxis protein
MSNKRALIVDDSTTAQYRLKKMLRPYNLQIDAVDSGEAALRYLASNAPDVIFMDHLMPGMDGFRALQIIKSHPETAMIPVIMYTSKSGDVYTGQARALGALDVVSKDTINATDLSKVMQAIHIFPGATKDSKTEAAVESVELIAAANQVSDSVADYPFEPISRAKAQNQAELDQARNLELRLSHLEHSLEDNRRFITSRVVRELQGLRQNLRQEFSDIIAHAPATSSTPAPATPETPLPPEPPVSRSGSSVSLVLVLVLLGIVIFYLIKMNASLTDAREQQEQLSAQLNNINIPLNKDQDLVSPAVQNLNRQQQLVAQQYANKTFLDDLTWAFNQSGTISFQQNNLDPRAAVRAYEFISRLLAKGFAGTIAVDLFVGDFCLAINPLGQAELAPPNTTLSNCMLSNEAYNLERVQDNYIREMEDALNNLARDNADKIQIAIKAYPGPEPYPDRVPIVPAGDWNNIAVRNNRMEIHLAPRQ